MDGKVLVVWGDMYRNMNEIRQFVTQKLNDKMHFLKPVNERHLKNLFIDKRYSGNVLTSLNTLTIIGMMIFFFVSLKMRNGKELLLLIPFFFILILYLALGTQMNFFEISFDKLIIRNHYFPWKKNEYNLADIEEVSLESPYRRSNSLRIITYQFQSKLYGAGSLRDRTWRELLDDLGSLGIKTKND